MTIFVLVTEPILMGTAGTEFAQQGVPIGPVGPSKNNTPIGGMVVLAVFSGGYAIKKLHDGMRQT